MMKKIIIVLLVAMILSISSCTNNSNIEDSNSNIEEKDNMIEDLNQEETKKITLPGKSMAVGVWHRPNVMGNETTLNGIKDTLNTFSKCGINIVYLETIYHGMAMYKSNLLPYYTGFEYCDYAPYKDYLSAFVAEATNLNIEVHAWVEDFYIGINKGRLATNHPEWLLLTASGKDTQSEGNGYLFLDPANTNVCDFLINVYYELLNKNPNIKGLNLDYIRYPVSSKSDDTGYTTVTKKGLLDKYSITYNDDNLDDVFNNFIKNNYQAFTDYRAEKITNFVASVRKMVDQYFKNIILSTAVFPDVKQSYETKKQDFTTWLKNKYIDVVTPMAYYDDINTFNYYLKDMVNNSYNTYCYTGVSCFYHNLSIENINQQIDSSISLSNGFVIFGSQKLLNNETYIKALNERFSQETYHLPHLDKEN